MDAEDIVSVVPRSGRYSMSYKKICNFISSWNEIKQKNGKWDSFFLSFILNVFDVSCRTA
jgi:hypothetical protein